jgi:hypothetical protein
MKKSVLTLIMAVMMTANVSAQCGESQWTFNTRAWTTNYWTSLIFTAAEQLVKNFAFDGNECDSLWGERLLPDPDLVFPIGMGKKGFDHPYKIFGPYHRAFGNPIKHIGDYGIGMDVSFHPSVVGFYAGAYFKSQEIVFKETNTNLRGFYFQPRAGLVIGKPSGTFEAGVFYDVLTGCGGTMVGKDKDMLKGGLGLDFALSSSDRSEKTKYLLQFSMPLHNFLNPDNSNPAVNGKKRKVGYIMLTQRVRL